MRRFVLCLTLCHFVFVFFSPFSIAITLLGEEKANLSAFRTFVRFVLVWICWFPHPLGVWEGLRFVIVALPGLFFYLFFKLYILRQFNYSHYCADVHCSNEHFFINLFIYQLLSLVPTKEQTQTI